MTAWRGVCRGCGKQRPIAATGRVYAHGRPRCPGSRRAPAHAQIWPRRYRGRRVRTVPGPDTWNPTVLEETP